MILWLLLHRLIPQCSAEFTMMLVWGEPNDISQCNNTGNIPFIDCYTICYNLNNCILAYQTENICYLCDFGTVESVTQKTYEDDMKVAMKVNATSSICPAVYPVSGQVEDGYRQPNGLTKYQIGYNGSSWSFNYSQASCPTGWKLFERQKGPWCIQVFYNTTYYYNRTDANKRCGIIANGAVLSGIENEDEYIYINTTAASLWGTVAGYVWLGAQLREECTPPSWNTTICNNTLTTFEWTDGFTTGTDGFTHWKPGKPDGMVNQITGQPQACLLMWQVTDSGQLDDATCYDPAVPSRTYSYLCGVQPS